MSPRRSKKLFQSPSSKNILFLSIPHMMICCRAPTACPPPARSCLSRLTFKPLPIPPVENSQFSDEASLASQAGHEVLPDPCWPGTGGRASMNPFLGMKENCLFNELMNLLTSPVFVLSLPERRRREHDERRLETLLPS
jgi:hypothetical protein